MRTTKLLALALLAAACQQDAGKPSRFAEDPNAPTPRAAARTGDLESRVAALEAEADKNRGAMDFLNEVYKQQEAQRKAQQEQEERTTPAPDAVFAIAIDGNAYDGPVGAPVTLVEAWDFA